MFRGGDPPPGSIVRRMNYPDNPWFGEPLKSEMEWDRRRDPDKYAHIWLGDYQKNSEARVFKNWAVEEFETPTNATKRLGSDWGFSVDPTVLISCFIGRWENGVAIADDTGRHLFVDYEAYQVGCMIRDTPALFDTVPDARKWLITADSARPETIAEMRLSGFPKIVAAIKGAGSIVEGVEFLKNFDIIVHPRCTHAIDDLTLYSYELDVLTGKVTNKLADKVNNVIDALRYACEGATRAARVKPRSGPVTIPTMTTGFNRR
jgi:phage terminase large subunit